MIGWLVSRVLDEVMDELLRRVLILIEDLERLLDRWIRALDC